MNTDRMDSPSGSGPGNKYVGVVRVCFLGVYVPFGFAAMAALVGMFSDQAVLKLKQVAETVFQKPLPGENAKPQETQEP